MFFMELSDAKILLNKRHPLPHKIYLNSNSANLKKNLDKKPFKDIKRAYSQKTMFCFISLLIIHLF